MKRDKWDSAQHISREQRKPEQGRNDGWDGAKSVEHSPAIIHKAGLCRSIQLGRTDHECIDRAPVRPSAVQMLSTDSPGILSRRERGYCPGGSGGVSKAGEAGRLAIETSGEAKLD